jgi:hypothetical protein
MDSYSVLLIQIIWTCLFDMCIIYTNSRVTWVLNMGAKLGLRLYKLKKCRFASL